MNDLSLPHVERYGAASMFALQSVGNAERPSEGGTVKNNTITPSDCHFKRREVHIDPFK